MIICLIGLSLREIPDFWNIVLGFKERIKDYQCSLAYPSWLGLHCEWLDDKLYINDRCLNMESFCQDVRVSSIDNGEGGASMIFPACCSQSNVIPLIKYNFSLSQHCIVFDFSLPHGGAIVGEDDELSFSWSKAPESGLVTEDILAAFHHQGQLVV